MQIIPAQYPHKFEKGIRHPDLYLWDSWSYVDGDIIHLYCLAVSRLKSDGSVLNPFERNNFPFHIRHFTSSDSGKSWKDEGCFLKPEPGNPNFRTVWSGSVEKLPNGNKLAALTTLEDVDSDHTFLQNIALATSSDGFVVDSIIEPILSSPRRDWDQITAAGYYLDTLEKLGNNDGEGGGPILAWRDPFIFLDANGVINLFWAGKVAPKKSALVRAEIQVQGSAYHVSKMYPPVTMPDGHEYTQLELPKVLYDLENDWYYLMISTCNRLYEGQSDEEVDKGVRLYKSRSLEGDWISLGDKILGSENLFGPTVLKGDFENNRLLCIAPYTDAAKNGLGLSFAPIFFIYLEGLTVEFLSD